MVGLKEINIYQIRPNGSLKFNLKYLIDGKHTQDFRDYCTFKDDIHGYAVVNSNGKVKIRIFDLRLRKKTKEIFFKIDDDVKECKNIFCCPKGRYFFIGSYLTGESKQNAIYIYERNKLSFNFKKKIQFSQNVYHKWLNVMEIFYSEDGKKVYIVAFDWNDSDTTCFLYSYDIEENKWEEISNVKTGLKKVYSLQKMGKLNYMGSGGDSNIFELNINL